jgi:N4-gp56 family major capsid protein
VASDSLNLIERLRGKFEAVFPLILMMSQVSLYGETESNRLNYVRITNQVEYTVEDQTLNQASRLLAQNMGETLDELTRDVLVSSGVSVLATGGINGLTPTEISQTSVDAVVELLLDQNADMISEIVEGAMKINTTPIPDSFFGFIHTQQLSDLKKIASFTYKSSYSQYTKALPSEWGSTGNVRWLYSSKVYKSAAATPIYGNPVVGYQAYGTVHLGSDSGNFYIKPLGSAGSADPLNQFGSAGWDHPYAARWLNDQFGAVLLCTKG